VFEPQAWNDPSPTLTSRIALYQARATFRRKEAEGSICIGAAERLYAELLQDVTAGQIGFLEIGDEVDREYSRILANPPAPIHWRRPEDNHLLLSSCSRTAVGKHQFGREKASETPRSSLGVMNDS
jgi:hypothetical protein